MTEVNAIDISTDTWSTMRSQAETLVRSGFLPKAVDTAEQALAIGLKGRELGIPMMQSITSIHVIDGKPTISAELMAALVFQRIPGAVLQCTQTSNTTAAYEAGRPGGKILRMNFTWEDAVKAGVTNKNNWKNYPAAMLRARCCSAICRVVFPDAIMGVYTPDELGAVTTEEGEVADYEVEVIDTTSYRAPDEGAPTVKQPQRRQATPPKSEPTINTPSDSASEAQKKAIYAIMRDLGYDTQDMKHEKANEMLCNVLTEPLESFNDLSKGDASALIKGLQAEAKG